MLNVLIIITYICWIAGFFVNGLTLYSFLIVVPSTMFALRKFGIHIKMSSIITVEVVFLFFSLTWKLLFKDFVLMPFILNLVVRAIFLICVIYDEVTYVYITEEKRKYD